MVLPYSVSGGKNVLGGGDFCFLRLIDECKSCTFVNPESSDMLLSGLYDRKRVIMKLDVNQILKQKLPGKKIPKPLIGYLKKIVHQKELNAFFAEAKNLENLDLVEKALVDHLQSGGDFEGLEHLPPEGGRYIFVSNHPLGGLDSLILGLLLGRHYNGKVKFFANDILMFLEPMKGMFLPVNKGGKGGNVRENVRAVEAFFRSDEHLITFPAGANSRKIAGKIQDLPWMKTFVTKAVQYRRDVVPIYFEGRNSNFFYNLSRIRKWFGLPNIEMLYLVDEMYKQRGRRFRVKIGKPIPYARFDETKTPALWAAWVRELVYEMALD